MTCTAMGGASKHVRPGDTVLPAAAVRAPAAVACTSCIACAGRAGWPRTLLGADAAAWQPGAAAGKPRPAHLAHLSAMC